MAGDRAELHLRHDWQPEGGGGASSRRLPECLCECVDVRDVTEKRVPVDAADVSLQRLDLYLGGDFGRRDSCLLAAGGAGADLRCHRRTWCYAYVRRTRGAFDVDPCAFAGATTVRPNRQDRDRRGGAAFDSHHADGGDGLRRDTLVWTDGK